MKISTSILKDAPNTALILGVALSGGDAMELARQLAVNDSEEENESEGEIGQ